MASSVVEFVTGIGDLLCYTKRYPLWFRYLSLNLPGGTRPFVLKLSAITMIVCSHFDAGPFVPGTTGGGTQRPQRSSGSRMVNMRRREIGYRC